MSIGPLFENKCSFENGISSNMPAELSCRSKEKVQYQISVEQKEELINKTKMAFEIADRITGIRSPLYLSGGTIRDILLGKNRLDCDYDFLGDFDLDKIQRKFSDFVVGRWDEVSTIKLKIGTSVFDFISTKNIEDTLSTWDISASTMYLSDDGTFCDNFEGLESLAKREIKICNAETKIIEDPCRILRIFRIAEELGFNIEDITLKTAIKYGYLLKNTEYSSNLLKILLLDTSTKVKILKNLYKYGIDQHLTYERDNDSEIAEIISLEEEVLAKAPIVKIVNLFDAQIYLVGGAMRDTILGKKVKDFDFKVCLPHQDIIDILQKKGFVQTTNLNLVDSQYIY